MNKVFIIKTCRTWYEDFNWTTDRGYYTSEELAQEEINKRILKDNILINNAQKSYDLYGSKYENGDFSNIPKEDLDNIHKYNSGELQLEYSIQELEKIK